MVALLTDIIGSEDDCFNYLDDMEFFDFSTRIKINYRLVWL